MPRIPVYEQQTAAGGRLFRPESTGSAAAGLADVGRGIASLAGAMAEREDNARRKQESDALAESHAAASRARAEWSKHLFERSQAAEPGAPEFTPKILRDFDEYQSKALTTAKTPGARLYLQEQLDGVRGDLELRAMQYEAGARLQHRVGLFEQATDSLRVAVRAAPETFERALADHGAALDATDIPAADRQRLWTVAKEQLAAAAVATGVDRNPGSMLKALRSAPGKSGMAAVEVLSPEGREQALRAAEGEIRRREAEARARAAEARQGLSEAEADAFAAKALGLDASLPSKAAYVAAYGAEGAKRHERKSRQFGVYDVVSAAVLMPPAEAAAALAAYRPTEQAGAAERAEVMRDALGLYERQRAAFEADPAGALVRRDPALAGDLEQALGGDADAVRRYVSRVRAQQESAGIAATRVLPAGVADQVAAQLQFDPAKPEQRTRNLQALAAQWGRAFPLVLRDVAPKLDGTARVLVGMAPEAAKRLDAALASGQDLGKTVAKTAKNDVTESVRSELEPFAATLADNVDFESRYAEHFEAAQTLALSMVARGETPSNAARQAAAAVVNDQYEYAGSARIPRGQPVEQILAGAEAAKQAAIGSERLAIPAGAYSDEAQAQSELKEAIRRGGYWVTNEDQSGLVLMVPTRRGRSVVETASGRYEFAWDQLADLGTASPVARQRAEAARRMDRR